MFFSTYVLTKKGPLAKIWLAAHWDKKLTKSEIRAIDLNQTIVHIIQPVVPIALRTSGELLIGVVRVYALKVKQLLKDATEATVLLRTANIQVVSKAALGKGADGLPISNACKDALAVTMDLVLSKGGAAPEDLCEADFDGIADLLKGGKGPAGFGGNARADEEVVGSAWFTVEPSQYLEEQLPLGADGQALEDGLARIRADLLALGEDGRRADSASSKSKSSTSSVEKTRKSGAAVLGYDQLDIGGPLPAEDELGAISAAAGDDLLAQQDMMMMMDMGNVFDVPDALLPGGDAEANAAAADQPLRYLPKKIKVVNVLDAASTVLAKADIDKCTRDRSDIVEQERRFGPVDAEDERNRQTLRTAETSVITLEPLSYLPNPALRAVFASALTASVHRVQQEIEKSRASQKLPTAAARASAAAGNDVFAPDDMFLPGGMDVAGPDFDFGGVMDIPNEMQQTTEQDRPARASKRGRDGAADDAASTPFSASTVATLASLKEILRNSQTTTFSKFSKGMRRVEVARSFVDVLALASHAVVDVRQSEPFGDVTVMRTAITATS